jgi:hypothetical protein
MKLSLFMPISHRAVAFWTDFVRIQCLMKIVWDNPIQHVALHQGLDARYWPDVTNFCTASVLDAASKI